MALLPRKGDEAGAYTHLRGRLVDNRPVCVARAPYAAATTATLGQGHEAWNSAVVSTGHGQSRGV
jgi:hypothetical protein